MSEIPAQVKVVLPSGGAIKSGAGSRVFINGVEFQNLEAVLYSTTLKHDDVVRSTISLTFAGDILVERDG